MHPSFVRLEKSTLLNEIGLHLCSFKKNVQNCSEKYFKSYPVRFTWSRFLQSRLGFDFGKWKARSVNPVNSHKWCSVLKCIKVRFKLLQNYFFTRKRMKKQKRSFKAVRRENNVSFSSPISLCLLWWPFQCKWTK